MAKPRLVAGSSTLYHDRLDSPLGPLVVGLTDRGLAAILLGPDATEDAEAVLEAEFPDLRPAQGRADEAMRQLSEYFAGRRKHFDLPLDLHGTPFQMEVLAALQRIPYGQTRSYLELARLTGRRGGARAVGQVVRRNRVPIVVPCHRIIAADGTLGGYGGRWVASGPYVDAKRFLLELELMHA